MRTLTPEQVVAEAAEWYDANYPGWWEKVDLGLLDMDEAQFCIAGQVIPSNLFSSGYHRLTEPTSDIAAPAVVHAACADVWGAHDRGVEMADAWWVPPLQELHDAWRDQIKRRFEEGL